MEQTDIFGGATPVQTPPPSGRHEQDALFTAPTTMKGQTTMPDLGASFHSLAGAVRCEHCGHALHSTADCPTYRGPRYGPWLPNVSTAPASYRGPLIYGSGLVFWAQDAWAQHA